MGFTLYLLYGVLVLKESDSELFLHVWDNARDIGKSIFDGADPKTPSETHPVVMMRQLTLCRSCTGIAHRCIRKVRGSGMEALLVSSSGELMLIDPLGVDDI